MATPHNTRILLLTEVYYPVLNGVSVVVDATIHHLQRRGYDVRLIAPDYVDAERAGCEIIPVRSLTPPVYRQVPMGYPLSRRTNRALDDFKPHILHTFGNLFLSWAASFAAQRRNIPVVGMFQTDVIQYLEHYHMERLQPLGLRMLRWMLANNDLTLVPSRSMGDILQSYGYNAEPIIWPHGVDTDLFTPENQDAAMRRHLLNGRPDDSLLVVILSRLAPEKKIEELRPIADLPGVALTIIGDGPHRKVLEKLYQGSDTFFTGMFERSDVATALASADLLVSASRSETFGLATLESIAAGTPVVAIDAQGTRDVIRHEYSGLLVEDAHDVLQAVAKLRDDPARREQLRRDARTHALQQNWDVVFDQLEAIYAQVLTPA